MKTFRIIALSILVALPLSAAAQGRINTKKFLISDFTVKTTKVVLTGNDVMDSTLKQEVMDRWTLSPFEFCSLKEFQALKNSAFFYFLVIAAGQEENGQVSGINFLTLVKGGSKGKGLEGLLEVAALPLGPIRGGTGRDLVFMPAILDILQDFTSKLMTSEISGVTGLQAYNSNLRKRGAGKRIILSEDDIDEGLDRAWLRKKAFGKIEIMEEDEADRIFNEGAPGTLVSYVVAPTSPVEGSPCYKMMIDAGSHTLYYFKKHTVSGKMGAGFQKNDIGYLTKGR